MSCKTYRIVQDDYFKEQGGIYVCDSELMTANYLHKDGTWNAGCGDDGFFSSFEEAAKAISLNANPPKFNVGDRVTFNGVPNREWVGYVYSPRKPSGTYSVECMSPGGHYRVVDFAENNLVKLVEQE